MGCTCTKDDFGGVASPKHKEHKDDSDPQLSAAADKYSWKVAAASPSLPATQQQTLLGVQRSPSNSSGRDLSRSHGRNASASTIEADEFAKVVESVDVTQSSDEFERSCREEISASPVLNINAVIKATGCDTAFVKEAFEMLVQQWTTDEGKIRAAFDSDSIGHENATIVREAAHSLKGASASLSVTQVNLAAKMLEDQAKVLQGASSPTVCRRAHIAFTLLQEAMATFSRQRHSAFP